MSYIASRWLPIAGILPALVLACLGLETAGSHPVGWLLLALSVAYLAVVPLAGSVFNAFVRLGFRRSGSLWLVVSGSLGVLLAAPVEHLAVADMLPAGEYLEPVGAVCTAGAAALGAWAHRARRRLKQLQEYRQNLAAWAQGGPYHIMRYPGFLALLIFALGLGLSYSSLAALAVGAILVLPALIMQIGGNEQRMLAAFGEGYRSYAARTARLLPGIW